MEDWDSLLYLLKEQLFYVNFQYKSLLILILYWHGWFQLSATSRALSKITPNLDISRLYGEKLEIMLSLFNINLFGILVTAFSLMLSQIRSFQ